jgi:hypothetical protein
MSYVHELELQNAELLEKLGKVSMELEREQIWGNRRVYLNQSLAWYMQLGYIADSDNVTWITSRVLHKAVVKNIYNRIMLPPAPSLYKSHETDRSKLEDAVLEVIHDYFNLVFMNFNFDKVHELELVLETSPLSLRRIGDIRKRRVTLYKKGLDKLH